MRELQQFVHCLERATQFLLPVYAQFVEDRLQSLARRCRLDPEFVRGQREFAMRVDRDGEFRFGEGEPEFVLQRLRQAGQELEPADAGPLRRLAIASDFAIDTLASQPGLLPHLRAQGRSPLPPPLLTADNRQDWPRLLRRYRQAESTRLVWRDVVEGAAVDEILAGM